MSGALRIAVEHAGNWMEWAPVASAGIAAMAAVASWQAVIQAGRTWKTGLLPELLPTVAIVGSEVSISVDNAGGGPARFASYAMVVGSEFAEGSLSATGYVRAGEGTVVPTGIRVPLGGLGGVQGAVFCEDRLGQQHAWSFDGAHEVYDAHPSRVRRFVRWAARRSRRNRRAVVASLYSDPTIRSGE